MMNTKLTLILLMSVHAAMSVAAVINLRTAFRHGYIGIMPRGRAFRHSSPFKFFMLLVCNAAFILGYVIITPIVVYRFFLNG